MTFKKEQFYIQRIAELEEQIVKELGRLFSSRINHYEKISQVEYITRAKKRKEVIPMG